MPWEPTPAKTDTVDAEATGSEAAAESPKDGASSAAAKSKDPSAAADDASETVAAEKPVEGDAPADKRLDTITKAEKRSRELIAKERNDAKSSFMAEVEQVKAELAPHMDSVKKYKAAVEKVRTDPVELMRSLGLSEDDFEYAAQQLYNHSKAAASDPKRAQAAAQARRERESTSELAQLRAEVQAIKAEKQQAAQQQTFEQQKAQYVDHVATNLPAEAPLLKKLLEKSPAKAKAELWKTAERLFAENNEMPDAEDLAVAYERQRRAELEELGVDVASVLSAKSVVAATPADKRPAKTLDATASQTTPLPKPAAKKTDAERRKEILDAMPWDTATS